MGQQWERSLFCQFQLLGSYWEVHWLKLTPGLNRVLGGKTTPPNIFFRPILPKFEEIFEIVVGDFERWPMLPVRKTCELKYQLTSINIWNAISCCFCPCKYITFAPSVRAVNMTTILTWGRGRKSKIVVRDENWPGGEQYSARSHQWCPQVEPGGSVALLGF